MIELEESRVSSGFAEGCRSLLERALVQGWIPTISLVL